MIKRIFALLLLPVFLFHAGSFVYGAISESIQYQTTAQNITPAGMRGVFPWVALDGNAKAHVVFLNQVGTPSKIEYVNNLNGSFGAVQDLATDATSASRPSIIAVGNKLHVAYTANNNTQLFYQQGTINGTSVAWSTREAISTANGTYDGRIAVDNAGNVHFVWLDEACPSANNNIRYRERFANGTLSALVTPMGNCAIVQDRPHIIVTSGGTPHIVFQHDRDVYYGRKDAAGWTTQNLTNTTGNTTNPRLATNGSILFTTWDDDAPSSSHDVFAQYSSDGGTTWSSPIGIAQTPGNGASAFMAWSPITNRIYIVFEDSTNGNGGKPEIYAREMDTSGSLSNTVRLTCEDGDSNLPIIATSGNQAQVVWQNSINATRQVFTVGAQISNGLSTASCALVPTDGPTATPTPGGGIPGATNTPTPTATPLPTYTPIPTDTPAPTATPACTNCFFNSPIREDTEIKEEDIIFYVVASAVYIMTIHFAISIKKEFKLNLMVTCFVLGFVIGFFIHNLTFGFVAAIILSLFLW